MLKSSRWRAICFSENSESGLSVMNLVDRFAVDEWWVGHTRAWTIHGTEDLKPYITARDRCVKWIFGTLGMAVISAALAGIMTLFIR